LNVATGARQEAVQRARSSIDQFVNASDASAMSTAELLARHLQARLAATVEASLEAVRNGATSNLAAAGTEASEATVSEDASPADIVDQKMKLIISASARNASLRSVSTQAASASAIATASVQAVGMFIAEASSVLLRHVCSHTTEAGSNLAEAKKSIKVQQEHVGAIVKQSTDALQ